MTIQNFSDWLASTALSEAIQNVTWVIPTVQTIHILSISVVMSSVLVVYLRVMGLLGRSQSVEQVMHRFLPWVWYTLVVLLFTGIILIIGEPGRSLQNGASILTMSLLIAVVIITFFFQLAARGNATFWESNRTRRTLGRVVASISLLMWVAIVCAGRMIAYVTTESS